MTMTLPIYQHPTMTVLVDDSPSFLHSLRFQLGAAFPSIGFSDTGAAIAWLRQHGAAPAALAGLLSPSVDTYTFAPQPYNIAMHVEQVCGIRSHPQRFLTPSVLVVDYSMPGMNGIEFCEAVRDLPCRKILLTGVADERIAIDAFNRGLIDRYVRKSDVHALDRLEAELTQLQEAYFLAQSEALRMLLSLHDYSFVNDPAICALVRELGARHKIVEHYLFKTPPGFLMYDRDARPWLLAVETEQSMNAQFEIALDGGAPPSLLEALEQRRVVPNFSDGDGMYSPVRHKEWHRYTTPAQTCHGRELYYWAMFALEPGFMDGPVASFSGFLRTQAAAA
jgi:CheY-like chemotaxis protein